MIDETIKPPSADELFYIQHRARDCARLPDATEADCHISRDDVKRRAAWIRAFRAERKRRPSW